MANEHKIEINKREHTSKKDLKKMRKDGNIPGIYYSGESRESIPIIIAKHDFNLALKSGARIFNIAVGDKKQNVLFKSVQYHPVTDEVIHIDLYGVRMDQAINIKVSIKLIGDAIGVKDEGGILNQPLNELEIQCLPGDIPDLVELDISELAMGSSLNANDIRLDEKFILVTPEDAVIVSVTQPMKEVEPTIETDEDEEFIEGEEGDEESSADKKEDGDASKDSTTSEENSDSE